MIKITLRNGTELYCTETASQLLQEWNNGMEKNEICSCTQSEEYVKTGGKVYFRAQDISTVTDL